MYRLTTAALVAALVSGTVAAQVKVAFIDPLSGPFASIGESAVIGFREAIAEVNAQGGGNGEKLELVTFDNKGSPQESLIQFKAVTDQGIRYITQGAGSGAAHALVEAVNKWNSRNPDKSVLFLNWAAVDPTLTNEKCSFWHFRFDANTDQKMHIVTDGVAKDKSIKKVFVIGQDYAHGKQVSEAAREMLKQKRPDIQIVGDELHPMGRVKDFGPYVAKIKASGADAMITGNWGNDLNLLVKAANDAGLKIPIYAFYSSSPDAPSAIGAAGEDHVYSVYEFHMNITPNKREKYALDYAAKHPGREFSTLRIVTQTHMLAKAMTDAKSTDPLKVARQLEGMRYLTDTGEAYMRKDDHQLMQPMYLSVFKKKNGKDVRFDAEKTGFGWKTIAAVSAAETEVPTLCKMERP